MIYHQHFASVLIYHPGRCCHMCHDIFAQKCIVIIFYPLQNKRFIHFFLLVIWLILFDTGNQLLSCHNFVLLVYINFSKCILILSQTRNISIYFPSYNDLWFQIFLSFSWHQQYIKSIFPFYLYSSILNPHASNADF